MPAFQIFTERLGARYRDVVADVVAAGAHGAGWTLLIKVGLDRIEALRDDANGPVPLVAMPAPPDASAIAALDEALARMTAPPGSTIIRIDPALSAIRMVPLPTRDDAYIRAILRNRVERLGPWRASQALFGYVIDGTEDGRQAQVKVAIVSRRAVDDLTSALERAGVAADRIEVGDDAGVPIQLVRALSVREQRAGRRMLAIYGAVVACLLTVLAGATGYDIYTASQLDQARLRLGTDAGAALDDGGGAQAAPVDGRILADRKAKEPLRLAVVNEISRLLPDTAWLTTLKIAGSEINMTGKARDVPSIIASVQASRILDDVRFAAPTVHTEGDDAGEFAVSASIRQGGRTTP